VPGETEFAENGVVFNNMKAGKACVFPENHRLRKKLSQKLLDSRIEPAEVFPHHWIESLVILRVEGQGFRIAFKRAAQAIIGGVPQGARSTHLLPFFSQGEDCFSDLCALLFCEQAHLVDQKGWALARDFLPHLVDEACVLVRRQLKTPSVFAWVVFVLK